MSHLVPAHLFVSGLLHRAPQLLQETEGEDAPTSQSEPARDGLAPSQGSPEGPG